MGQPRNMGSSLRLPSGLLSLLRFLLIASSAFSISCAKELITQNSTPVATVSITSESSYCSTVTSYSPSVTLTGKAQFYYRATDTTLGLNGSPVAGDIPYAEVTVKNSSGAIVQCGTTAADGTISVAVPKVAGTYSVIVSSRGSNAYVKASVLEDPSGNAPYSISQSFTLVSSDTTKNVGTFYAYARLSESSKIEGGAFNIFYDIWKANHYLRTALSDSTFVAPKVTVYWKAGFNPYSYFGYPDNLVSFYKTGQRVLYILGGKNGNVKTADTDHFDDSVVLHEYGHFLEDVYAKSESPGGSHSGTNTIDPRLAWSEGWANFFQAAVLGDRYYIDTVGFSNDSGETGESGAINIKFDLVESGTAAAYFDRVSDTAEGTFREVSISRTLYKIINTPYSTSAPLAAAIPFSEIWNVFKSTTAGFASSNIHFRNIATFLSYLDPTIQSNYSGNNAAWTAIKSNEKQAVAPSEYANPISSQSSCGVYPKNISPVADNNSGDGAVTNDIANWLKSSDYYSFYHDGSSKSIKLNYTQVSGQTIDLDLIVYKEDHYQSEDYLERNYSQSNSTIAVRSRRAYGSIEFGQEIVSLAGLAAGYYLVQVKANTYDKTSAQMNGQASYELKQVKTTETFLCPQN